MQITELHTNNRRSTGIGGLDFTLDGGIPFGTTIVAFGSPYSGIELMAKQFWKAEETDGSYLMLDAAVEDGMKDASSIPLSKLKPLMTGDRIIVDSLSSLVVQNGIDEVTQFIRSDIKEILDRGANIMFIVYRGVHTPVEEMRITRAADVFMELRQDIHGNEVTRTFALYKMKGSAVPDRVVPFIITEKGLELSTTSRVV
jgi:KaiC/GvpD/RAD55 family RecA-like ATPase